MNPPTVPTIVEVWAPGCAECKAMQPDLDTVAETYTGSTELVMINAADDLETVRSLRVKGTPTLIGFRNGEEAFRFTGRRNRAELETLFASLAAGHRPTGVGRQDLFLRVGTGVVLAVAGLLGGPAWVLVGIGAVVVAFGMTPVFRSGR